MSKIEVNQISSQCGSTLTIGQSGDTVTLAAGATQTGFGRTGTVDWDTTPKTATFSAVSGNGYFCNTTSSAFTVNLPAGSAGAIVSLADYAATWQTNNLTVSPNGSEKIGSVNGDAILNTEGQSVTFVYVDSTQGWINTMDSTSNVRGSVFLAATGGTITTCGNCKIHTFTGPGTFCVSEIASCSANNKLGYLVVAGGASGGQLGGGGAGGFREGRCNSVTPYTASPLVTTAITATAQAYSITVGAGGAANPANGVSGNNSVALGITSAGGGGTSVPPGGRDGGVGGSGGGAGGNDSGGGTAGCGNTPPVSPPQGNSGGAASTTPGGSWYGAGGGGATAAGAGNGSPGTGGTGGNGATTSISATPTTYAGGGGGGSYNGANPTSPGSGGSGGGGAGGGGAASPNAVAGSTNTGGGAGGNGLTTAGSGMTGENGGSGIVIIRYKFQ
jgi:hypothetical protein